MSPFSRLLDRLSGYYLEEQIKELDIEEEALAQHLNAARKFAKQVPPHARILIIDVSQKAPSREMICEAFGEEVAAEIQQRQYGGSEVFSHAQMFRHLMGFEPGDERIHIWDVTQDWESVPQADAWIMTGGPAMPSEIGMSTQNSAWLERSLVAIHELFDRQIPGLAVCLGHQLVACAHGAEVKRMFCREFGTVHVLTDPIRLFKDWNGTVSASHTEAVASPPEYPGMFSAASNGYHRYQSFVFPLGAESLSSIDTQDRLVVTIQNHPEILGSTLFAVAHLRREALMSEGFNVEEMIFRDTSSARIILLNFLLQIARITS